MESYTLVESYAAEVATDSTGTFSGNGLRFGTRIEAEKYAKDLMNRWTLVYEWRVVESHDAPNYLFVDGALVPIK